MNRRAKEYDPTQDKQAYSNVWDEALACIGAAIITGVIELATELPARMIEKQREEEKHELRQKEEAEKRKCLRGLKFNAYRTWIFSSFNDYFYHV